MKADKLPFVGFHPSSRPLLCVRLEWASDWTGRFRGRPTALIAGPDQRARAAGSPYTYVDVIMADGATIHYDRISKGTDYADAVYEHHARTAFLGSLFKWNGNGWDLRFADGSLFVFPENYSGVRPNQGAPLSMQDAAGHRITFERDGDRNLKRLHLHRVISSRSITTMRIAYIV